MSKDLKLYVPVIMPSLGKRRHITMIGVHNCSLLQKEVPSREVISKHLLQQSHLIRQGLQFSSIKISLLEEKFEPLKKELSSKVGGQYKSSIIDIVAELGQKPLIQIIQKK